MKTIDDQTMAEVLGSLDFTLDSMRRFSEAMSVVGIGVGALSHEMTAVKEAADKLRAAGEIAEPTTGDSVYTLTPAVPEPDFEDPDPVI